MNDRRIPVKAALLLAPLLVAILALHAWGDALAGGLGRAVGNWQYPERAHAPFQIRVPRRSDDVDAFAARALAEFVSQAIKAHGSSLSLQPPSQPVKVVLLELDTDVRRFGWTAAESLVSGNEGLYDSASRTIFVRMERKLQQEPMIAALRQAAARMLLHDAGSSRWSFWLTEGLVGRLEGVKPAVLRNWPGDLPSLNDLHNSREADFKGITAPAYSRGAKLLVAYLMETKPQEFEAYYKTVREGAPAPLQLFADRFNDLLPLERDWRDWIQLQK